MTSNAQINSVANELKEELNTDIDLSIGKHESPAQTGDVISERIDKILALMEYQALNITKAQEVLEEAQYQHKRKEQIAKTKYNRSLINFKSEDRLKPKDQRRTDVEYTAMAELECNTEVNEAISAHREYMSALNKVNDEKHRAETLEAHFTGYKKQAELLIRELGRFGDGTLYKKTGGSY